MTDGHTAWIRTHFDGDEEILPGDRGQPERRTIELVRTAELVDGAGGEVTALFALPEVRSVLVEYEAVEGPKGYSATKVTNPPPN